MSSVVRPLPSDPKERPFLVIWEVTQACDLACKHCRANAVTRPHPQSLTYSEGRRLIEQIASFGKPFPLVVFTGGDPFKRDDLYELVAYAHELGLHAAVSPSGTPLLTREALQRLQKAGCRTISLSLDGSSPVVHDAFRGVSGSFELTMAGARAALELGLKLQINTTIGRHNLHDLVHIAGLVAQLRVLTWSVFLLVPTGRAQSEQCLTPDDVESVLHFLVDVSDTIPLKTTEGHHYKRVLLMRHVLDTMELAFEAELQLTPLYFELRNCWEQKLREMGLPPRRAARRRPLHLNSGHGFVFINHLGYVFPSGFLPIAAGNVRQEELPRIYRDSPLFRSLREPVNFTGRCGSCEFRQLCGGSRSRAYACSGNFLGEDPACAYQPGSFPYRRELKTALGGFLAGSKP